MSSFANVGATNHLFNKEKLHFNTCIPFSFGAEAPKKKQYIENRSKVR
jgi:hypothetical protein